jgi:hypothetical protein
MLILQKPCNNSYLCREVMMIFSRLKLFLTSESTIDSYTSTGKAGSRLNIHKVLSEGVVTAAHS